MSWLTTAIAKGALGAWMMDETSGTTAADSSGASRAMTLNSPVTVNAAAVMPTALRSFDFSGGFLERANDSGMNTASFSVDAWINADATSSYRCIWSKDGTSPRGPSLYITGGKLNLFTSSDHLGTATLSTGTDYHVAVTYDSATTTIKFYINGAADATLTASVDNTAAWAMMWGASRAGGTTAAFPFDGKMGPGAFYGTALSGADVADLYSAGSPAPAPSGAASITLSGSATGGASSSGAGSLTLSASGTAAAAAGPTAAAGAGSLTLSGTAVASPLYVTDTSNALDGLDITFTGTATVERPPAPVPAGLVLAEKYDKAIAYPQPVMDNGRPS